MDVEKSAPTSTGGSVGVQSVMRPRRPSLSNPHDRARNLTQADIRACSPPTCFVDFMSASVAYVICMHACDLGCSGVSFVYGSIVNLTQKTTGPASYPLVQWQKFIAVETTSKTCCKLKKISLTRGRNERFYTIFIHTNCSCETRN